MSLNENDKDSFWSLEKLTPKKKMPLQRFTTEPSVTDFEPESNEKNDDCHDNKEQRRLTFSEFSAGTESPPEKIYFPENSLLKKITVKHICDKYDFHANFRKAAKLYFDFYTHECEFAKFYSYMPQYTQFTHDQKNYYFYWRYCLRHGKYIKTDYSYFYLYIYEIINLPDLIPPENGISLMIDVWCAYHKDLPNINSNMALWVQDYCIVYGIECPMDRIKDFVFYNIGVSGLKEFYLSRAESLGHDGVSALILYLSDYDWRSTRYASGEMKDVYALHLIGAMTSFFKELFKEGKILSGYEESVFTERTAFRGALVTADSKYKIAVEYKPLLDNTEVRKSVTSAVKYTENKLRALMSVKSRLAVRDLTDNYKSVIDGYFEKLFSEVNRKRIEAQRPEYERLYDAESSGLSSLDAESIENDSWAVTARLVDVEEQDEIVTPEPLIDFFDNKSEQNGDMMGLTRLHADFVSALILEDFARMKAIAAELGEVIDSVADDINSVFADNFGDIIMEQSGDVYVIIEDYREDVEEWLKKILK